MYKQKNPSRGFPLYRHGHLILPLSFNFFSLALLPPLAKKIEGIKLLSTSTHPILLSHDEPQHTCKKRTVSRERDATCVSSSEDEQERIRLEDAVVSVHPRTIHVATDNYF